MATGDGRRYQYERSVVADTARRVTLRDVAREASVSLKTASNVINGTGRMSEETRRRVQDVIDRLGYQVNIAARNLNRNRTGAIIFAVPSLTPPYLAQLANQVIEAARKREYSVYVTTYDEHDPQGTLSLLESFNATVADGMILSLSELVNVDHERLSVRFPLVVLGARDTGGYADHISPDDIDAAAQAVGYLYDRGATSVAVIGARDSFDANVMRTATEGNAQLRLRGIIEESDRRGIAIDPRLIGVTGMDWTIGSGARVMRTIMDGGVPCDGVVALNDQLAIGALAALAELGVSVPDQMQVIGFDDIPEDRYLPRPLSTMDPRLEWIATTAVDRILGRIRGSITEPENMDTHTHVIARGTTR